MASSASSSFAPRPLFTLRSHDSEVQALAFFRPPPCSPFDSTASPPTESPASAVAGSAALAPLFLASGDVAGDVKVWNLASRRVVMELHGVHAPRGVLQVDYHEGALLTQGREGCVALWDVNRGCSSSNGNSSSSSGGSGGSGGEVAQLASFDNACHGFCRAEFLRQEAARSVCADGGANGGNRDDAGVKQSGGDGEGGSGSAVEAGSRDSDGIGGRNSSQDGNGNHEEAEGGDGESSATGAAANGTVKPQVRYSGHHLVVSPAADGEEVVVWDVRARNLAFRVPTAAAAAPEGPGMRKNGGAVGPRGGMCMALASCTHDGRPYVYVGMESGSVGLFDLAEQRCCGVAGAGLQVLPCPLLGLATSPFKKGNKQFVVCGGAKREIATLETDWNTLETKVTSRLQVTAEASNGAGSTAAIRGDMRLFCCGGWDGRVRVYQRKNNKPLAVLRHRGGAVHQVRFSLDGNFLGVASKDSNISIWSIFPPKPKQRGD